MTFYKATRPDGTSFYDGVTRWQVGRIVRHPAPMLEAGLCSSGVLHFSDAPGETLVGGSWPCRLFEVEPRGEVIGPDEHKYGRWRSRSCGSCRRGRRSDRTARRWLLSSSGAGR